MPKMNNFIIRDNVHGEILNDNKPVPAANGKSALKKYRKMYPVMSTCMIEYTIENGNYHERTTIGGDLEAVPAKEV